MYFAQKRRPRLVRLPLYIGLGFLILSLPAAFTLSQQNQDIRNRAQSRTFTRNTQQSIQPGKIIVKYQPNLEITTAKDIDQHKDHFELRHIRKGLPNHSLNNLEAVSARRMERVFKEARLPQEKNAIQSLLGFVGLGPKPDSMANYFVVDIPANASVEQAITILLKDPDIESAQPSHIIPLAATPNDPNYGQQWALPKIQAPEAWDIATGSNSVIVAIVDTGIDLSHPDLMANLVQGTNIVDPNQSANDTIGHGTHIAGIIGAVANNSAGVVGVNWQVKLMPVLVAIPLIDPVSGQPVFGTSDDVLAAGIRWAADHNAKVINLSLGAVNPSPPQIVSDAVTYAAGRGAVIVAAAGNFSSNVSQVYPANLPQAIAVSNTRQDDTINASSGFGTRIDLAAPGTLILNTMASTNQMTGCSGQSYCSLSGTSTSAPHVAGVAALLLAVRPNLNRDEIKTMLTSTTDTTGTQDREGNPIRRLNAFKAVQAAQNTQATPTPNPTSGATPTPGSTATPTPQPTASSGGLGTALENLAQTINTTCPQAAPAYISRRISQSATAGSNWASYTKDYQGSVPFAASSEVFITVKAVCQVTVNGSMTFNLVAGTNKVTLPNLETQVQIQSGSRSRNRNVIQRLLGR